MTIPNYVDTIGAGGLLNLLGGELDFGGQKDFGTGENDLENMNLEFYEKIWWSKR